MRIPRPKGVAAGALDTLYLPSEESDGVCSFAVALNYDSEMTSPNDYPTTYCDSFHPKIPRRRKANFVAYLCLAPDQITSVRNTAGNLSCGGVDLSWHAAYRGYVVEVKKCAGRCPHQRKLREPVNLRSEVLGLESTDGKHGRSFPTG